METPWRLRPLLSCMMAQMKGSIIRLKIRGLYEHPCLTPAWMEISSDNPWWLRMVVVFIVLRQRMTLPPSSFRLTHFREVKMFPWGTKSTALVRFSQAIEHSHLEHRTSPMEKSVSFNLAMSVTLLQQWVQSICKSSGICRHSEADSDANSFIDSQPCLC